MSRRGNGEVMVYKRQDGRWEGAAYVFSPPEAEPGAASTVAPARRCTRSSRNRSFNALLARTVLRHVRLHDLRHTCASLLLAQGVPPRVVMETLGHSAIAVTMNTYSQVLPSLQRDAADRMNDLLA